MIGTEAEKFLRDALFPLKDNKYKYYTSDVINAAEYDLNIDNLENFLVELAYFKYDVVKKMYTTMGEIRESVTEITAALDVMTFDLMEELETQDKIHGLIGDMYLSIYPHRSPELDKFGETIMGDINPVSVEKQKAEIIQFSDLQKKKKINSN